MLFPTWNYIPQNAHAGGGGGYLELIDPPVCVTPEAMTFDPGGSLTEAISVKRAAELLKQRSERSMHLLCVCVHACVFVTAVSLARISLSLVTGVILRCVSVGR